MLFRSNYNPKTDSYFSRGPLDVLDHTSPVCGFGGKLCIDATKKLPEEGVADTDSIMTENFITYVHSQDQIKDNIKIAVILDKEFDLTDRYRNLWLLGGNVDMIRDSSFITINGNQILVLDARKKIPGTNGFNRRWPDIVESSKETKEKVEKLLSKIL